MSINNNTGSDFVNLDEFKTAHKNNWYNKLFAAIPNDATPLRTALSTAGRLYAGKYNSSTLNGVSVTDPLQYSCQQNFTILSTDGFWNRGAGYMLDGSTLVGDQDGGWPPPYNDGGTAVTQQRTSRLQSSTETQRAEKGTLQSRTSQRQASTSNGAGSTPAPTAKRRTSSNSGVNLDGVGTSCSCNPDNSGSSRTQCRYTPWTSWSDVGPCEQLRRTRAEHRVSELRGNANTPLGTSWSGTASCNAVTRYERPVWDRRRCHACQTIGNTAYANAASCAVTTPDASGNFTDCQYTFAAAAATQTCTPAYAANDYTNPTVYRNLRDIQFDMDKCHDVHGGNGLQRLGHEDNMSLCELVRLGHCRNVHPGRPIGGS